jgi:hypothetical protein
VSRSPSPNKNGTVAAIVGWHPAHGMNYDSETYPRPAHQPVEDWIRWSMRLPPPGGERDRPETEGPAGARGAAREPRADRSSGSGRTAWSASTAGAYARGGRRGQFRLCARRGYTGECPHLRLREDRACPAVHRRLRGDHRLVTTSRDAGIRMVWRDGVGLPVPGQRPGQRCAGRWLSAAWCKRCGCRRRCGRGRDGVRGSSGDG